ncbi:aminodeoxychorismate synthase component I [Altererythrobacter aerius]|uniref:Probable branched-chain-amino-acid aminotransferase n=1 Tax=Tsuneonella aeria TaxID=1837929 RepID=A0A6I4TE53_9SPHN|nr:aminodeoxychorismate synthase component I [Tsuneonella aeria]MXO75591.1 aminodeoxychorismate synthase component I [Tsuneonella aeria]
MAGRAPFVLLDDARGEGAADAHLFENPQQVFVARTPQDVAAVLAEADAARAGGGTLAGFIAYEAGLALEPRLAPLAEARTGAGGPLVWLGLFEEASILPAADVPAWLGESGGGPASLGPLVPQISPGAYAAAFEAVQVAIRAGDIYQANLTFPLAGGFRGDPLALYAALRGRAAAGYGGVVFDGQHWLLSLSPELFVSLRGAEAKAKPMKGTRPRATDEVADRALAEELAASAKDRAENLMILDLMRNDLSRVAEAGSVRVEAPFAVESYPTVHQMVSTVRARLSPGQGAMDLVRALFPCGSITGAPKIRAMEIIGGVERDARGPYCGAIGRIGPPDGDGQGEAAFNVAIRTVRLTEIENGQGTAVLGVGSAVVADSEPLPEWRESLLKAGFARLAAPGFDLVETMRFDPQDGVPLLDLHLERIGASAAALGFVFDRHAARNRIQALLFDLEAPARIRLLASARGEIALEAAPLPAALAEPFGCIALPLPVDSSDWRLRHKTTDRNFYDAARQAAEIEGAGEALFVRDDGLVTEGTFTNVFLERDGILITPPAAAGLLPGVLRRSLIDGGHAREVELTLDDLAGGFLIGNALRGLIKARLV